jgi:hypothetical protein
MSALAPKADMCGATRNVRYGPKATLPDTVFSYYLTREIVFGLAL